MFALIDCNNFYVSCERTFQPELEGKAGVVLSNNDGCAIARSQEAKDLGIKMGAPFFEIRDLVDSGKLWWRSSNYPLYQDMMRRVTSIIFEFFPEEEIYSIDESFCDLRPYKQYQDKEALARALRVEIKQCTGIPVCIGIGPTKTLAKVANRIAKKQYREIGVHVLDSANKIEAALKSTNVEDVWGIGEKHGVRLIKMKVMTAFEFTKLPPGWVQDVMTIMGLRMWQELNGMPVHEIAYETPAKKGIGTARSFGGFETTIEPMESALATYVANAALKLRKQNCVCAGIYIFAHTSKYANPEKNYSNGLKIRLSTPTNFTTELTVIAIDALRKIFKGGYRYQKCGVQLIDIRPAGQIQQSLFDTTNQSNRTKLEKITKAMDKVNALMGKDVVRSGAMDFERKWIMKQQYLSKRFTTRITDLVVVKAR